LAGKRGRRREGENVEKKKKRKEKVDPDGWTDSQCGPHALS